MEIGGFLEFELNKNKAYHQDGAFFNSGRNALRAILRQKKFSKIFIPYFTCSAITQVLDEEGFTFEFYEINEDLLPIFNYSSLKESELIIINNYWGLLNAKLEKLLPNINNWLLDNAQGFYYKPTSKGFVIYSPRKFFGVPDGGIAIMDNTDDFCELESQKVIKHMTYLVERMESGSETAYQMYIKSESDLATWPLRKMSRISRNILNSINYEKVKEIRKENYKIIENNLGELNKLSTKLQGECVPLYYPFFVDNGEKLRRFLNSNKIYNPLIWPNVLEWTKENQFEHYIAKHTVNIPIDQRYSRTHMEKILNKTLDFLKR